MEAETLLNLQQEQAVDKAACCAQRLQFLKRAPHHLHPVCMGNSWPTQAERTRMSAVHIHTPEGAFLGTMDTEV